ncbi:MAG: hypothetical protein H7256_02365 [Bdellovibrio sp.]|nr:hypothetical protein [Bdellovibrio sp.]
MTSPHRNKYLLAGLLSVALALILTIWLKKRTPEDTFKKNENQIAENAAEQIKIKPDTAAEKSFADILLTEFKTFDSEKILARIESYNLDIRKKYAVTEDQITMPKNFHRFELNDSNKYAVLNQELVEKSHTDGTDSGLDLIQSDIFLKSPFEKIISLAGPIYFIPHTEKVISIPTENSCLGHVPTGSGRVFNLKTKKEIFKFDFPEGSRDAIILENTKPNEFHFDLKQELPIANPQTTCEVGEPIESIKSTYLITCHNDGGSCLLVANEVERTEGCPQVAACD